MAKHFADGVDGRSGRTLLEWPPWSSYPKEARVYLAGHTGLVGRAIVRALARHGYAQPVTRDLEELDLTDQAATRSLRRRQSVPRR